MPLKTQASVAELSPRDRITGHRLLLVFRQWEYVYESKIYSMITTRSMYVYKSSGRENVSHLLGFYAVCILLDAMDFRVPVCGGGVCYMTVLT